MKFTIIHPTRSRPVKSEETITNWFHRFNGDYMDGIELLVSLDDDDPAINQYNDIWASPLINKNRSCVDAINNAAKVSTGDIIIVVSDDTNCPMNWNNLIEQELAGKEDFLLKTDDGIQDYIVTMTVMDHKYYERDGFIYHPDFKHQFADTYLTVLADVRGRLMRSKLKFPHLHYSTQNEQPDELHKRNDTTWRQGQDTFFRLTKDLDINKISNRSMQNFIRSGGRR